MWKKRHNQRQFFTTLPFFCFLLLLTLTGCQSVSSSHLPQMVVIDCSTGTVYPNNTSLPNSNHPKFEIQELKHQITQEEN